jgi:hypothetical protein
MEGPRYSVVSTLRNRATPVARSSILARCLLGAHPSPGRLTPSLYRRPRDCNPGHEGAAPHRTPDHDLDHVAEIDGQPLVVLLPEGGRKYWATVDEVPRRERGAGKRDTLGIDGGIDQHAGTVQHRPLGNRGGDAGGIEPSRPTLPVVETQQRKPQQIRCFAYAVLARDAPRAANREKPLAAKTHDIPCLPMGSTCVINRAKPTVHLGSKRVV